MESEKRSNRNTKFLFKLDKWLIVTTALSVLLLVGAIYQYVTNQQFNISPVEKASLQEIVAQNDGEIKDQTVRMSISDYEWSQLLSNYLEEQSFGSYKIVHVLYEDGTIHMEIENDKGKPYSYTADISTLNTKNDLELQLSSFRMGTLDSKILGFLSSKLMDIPQTIPVKIALDNEFVYVANADFQNGEVLIDLHYDRDKLQERMQDYQSGIDQAKLALQKELNKVNPEVIGALQATEIGEAEQNILLNYAAQGEEALTNLALIFNEDTTRQFLGDFKDLYAKRINIERVVERSLSELEQNVQAYHHQFSRGLLHYLYNNPTYTTNDGTLQVNGQTVNATTIVSLQNMNESYKTTIESDEKYLYAKYQVGDKQLTKVILKKGGTVQ